MAYIEHDLLRKQKPRKNNLKVRVDLYAYASELYDELSSIGIIKRLKNISQLGLIKVEKKLAKSRYDYVVLQLYLHQMIKKSLQSQLALTYNNLVKPNEFRKNFRYKTKDDKPTIGDMLQILTIAYNIGHFFNTFTASRAVIMLAEKNPEFRNILIKSSSSQRFQITSEELLNEYNYLRLHLINSLLVLEHCDQNKQSVILAQELLYAYLREKDLPENSKLHYVFELFRSVRNVSYIAYDLQIANTPLTIDLCNEKAILLLLKELISIYNDQLPANQMLTSIRKMLNDTLYNESSNAICYYSISRKMASILNKQQSWIDKDYYSDIWLSEGSVLNTRHKQSHDYSSEGILKLTFSAEDKSLSKDLLLALERVNNSRVGYYDRYSGERTLLVSIKKKCSNKPRAAFRILKTTISYLRKVSEPSNLDTRFLLASKFFLHYFFNENQIVIKPTIDQKICVLCTRGKNSRSSEIKSLLNNGIGSADERHEVEYMYNCLIQDTINDTSIIIPGSILVYKNGKKLSEFDGMIIHPMRKKDQVILLESKNKESKPLYAKKCLSEKLDKLSFPYKKSDIQTHGYDCQLKVSL
ncbi:hypothetical protein SCACP_26120 [Sporomusa carbonis]|jgi:hypothetical protein|uniref:hypothetical protein n=1 Tax=Sporomusa carbonis TaxID=3076075 RepID=UPI003A73BDAC